MAGTTRLGGSALPAMPYGSFAGRTEEIQAGTPAERILVIAAEPRSLVIDAEPRTFVVD